MLKKKGMKNKLNETSKSQVVTFIYKFVSSDIL